MTYVRLVPTSTTGNSGALTGGASAHAVLSDSSDSSYVTYESGEGSILGMTDLTLPSGAAVVLAQMLVRCKKTGSGPAALQSSFSDTAANTIVTWTSPIEVAGAAVAFTLTDADIDAAVCGVANTSILGDLVAYEMVLRVFYLTQPTVTVDGPTGTVTLNQATVSWTPSFDPDIGGSSPFIYHYYEIRVFNDTQYGIGGFDPATSPATLEVAQTLTQGSHRHSFTERLPDDDYRAYVRVAASSAPTHKSDWAYSSFTVDAQEPGVPSSTLTAQSTDGRIRIVLGTTSGDVSTTLYQLERSDDGGTTWLPVRTDLDDGWITPVSSAATVYDYEAPNGVTVSYRVRAWNSAQETYSAWSTKTTSWSSNDWWIKHATNPTLNRALTLRSYPGHQTQSNQGVFRVLGSTEPVVVEDTRGPVTGTIVTRCDTLAAERALEATLAEQAPMLLQGPVSHAIPERWVVFGDVSSERLVDGAVLPHRDYTLSWTQVARPTGPLG